MINELALAVFFAAVATLSAIGAVFVFSDYRHFPDIEQQCKERGYIQNTKTRINCSVEVSK